MLPTSSGLRYPQYRALGPDAQTCHPGRAAPVSALLRGWELTGSSIDIPRSALGTWFSADRVWSMKSPVGQGCLGVEPPVCGFGRHMPRTPRSRTVSHVPYTYKHRKNRQRLQGEARFLVRPAPCLSHRTMTSSAIEAGERPDRGLLEAFLGAWSFHANACLLARPSVK